jgi:hypothetical protein
VHGVLPGRIPGICRPLAPGIPPDGEATGARGAAAADVRGPLHRGSSHGWNLRPPASPLFDEARLAVAGFPARSSGPTCRSRLGLIARKSSALDDNGRVATDQGRAQGAGWLPTLPRCQNCRAQPSAVDLLVIECLEDLRSRHV